MSTESRTIVANGNDDQELSSCRVDSLMQRVSNSLKARRLNATLLLPVLLGALACFSNGPPDFDYDIDVASITEVNRALQSSQPATVRAASRPNVIYIQHESLSGAILLNTAMGVFDTPFFHHMAKDPDFYVFQHHRAVSGNTIDAMPALMTGCLPFKEEGIEYAHATGRSIGYEFAEKGYATASFSSRALDKTIKTGQWSMLYDLLAGGVDRVEDATGNPRVKLNNGQGSSDAQMLPLFAEWLDGLDRDEEVEGGPAKPFYAQFYNFNQHFPYLKPGLKKGLDGQQYYKSLQATDKFLKTLFDILSSAGHLENTIIVGSGDHGEDPFKLRYARLPAWNSLILHSAAYMYYPRHLMAEEGVGERLRRNGQRLTYTLDMYPTIRSILHSASGTVEDYHNHPLADPNNAAVEGCIAGVDLTSMDIPDDRVVLSMNLASGPLFHAKPLQLWAISTRDAALYHRIGKYSVPKLRQGQSNKYVLLFGLCTRSTIQLCMTSLNEEWKEHFRRAVVSQRHGSGFVGEEVNGSEILQFFVKMIGGESAIEATENAMAMESSMISSAEAMGERDNL